jgi:2-polyprenyl-6-methoxyphenol hydroxylase-like FAD-dependent oxidoreductase
MTNKPKILIVGAGIGGLATAIALQQAGFEVEIYENAPVLRGIGAGISLWSNATAVLEKLGLLDEAVSKSAVYKTVKVQDERGKLLMQTDIGNYPTPSICIHRADLIDLLKRNCAPGTIHLGKTFERFEQSETKVTALFADGTSAGADILIGADGIHSRVRSQIKGDSKLIYRGYAIWRSTVEFDSTNRHLDSPSETFGKGKRVGLVPIGKNRFYWYATNNQPENLNLPAAERKAQLLKFFQHWHAPIPQIIAATNAENILHNDCYDRLPERGWSAGRVCLIGDAAHPTTPNLGQGGCMALEDAIVLTKCLRKSLSSNDAFREFEELRFARTKFITERSLMIGNVGQWQNPLAVFLRNSVTRLTPEKSLQKNFEPIYGFQA